MLMALLVRILHHELVKARDDGADGVVCNFLVLWDLRRNLVLDVHYVLNDGEFKRDCICWLRRRFILEEDMFLLARPLLLSIYRKGCHLYHFVFFKICFVFFS